MKRKQIEKLPVLPVRKKTGYVAKTVRWEDYLVIDIHCKAYKSQTARYAVNLGTGEYGCMVNGEWNGRKFSNLIGLNPHIDGSFWQVPEDFRWDTPEDLQTVSTALEASLDGGEQKRKDWQYGIERLEGNYQHEKFLRAKEREYDRIGQMMAAVPEPGKAFEKWIFEECCPEYFLIYDKERGDYICGHCGAASTGQQIDPGRELKHNAVAICPNCKRAATVKRRQREVTHKGRAMQIQALGGAYNIARHYKYEIVQDLTGGSVFLDERVRVMLNKGKKGKPCKVFYEQDGGGHEWWTDLIRPAWYTTNPYNRRSGPCHLYPEGIREGLAGTEYKALIPAFEAMAAMGVYADYNAAMAAEGGAFHGIAGVLEYLVKGRFRRLLKETVDGCDRANGAYYGPLSVGGADAREVFGLSDRQKINRIRDEDGGDAMVWWLRYTEQFPQKISRDSLAWLCASDLNPGDLAKLPGGICGKMSLEKIVHYIKRQLAAYATPRDVMQQWGDYLSMMEAAGKRLDDELFYKPKDLKAAHDRIVTDRHKQEAVRRLAEDPAERQQEAAAMEEKFPEAAAAMRAVKEKYEYASGEFLFRMPSTPVEVVEEGYALHHCAGSSERYFNRIAQRETYIGFCRRASEPEIPYYTVEFEPDGTIRQNRSYYDEEPGIEEIRGFMREWQQVIKKRMTRKDWEDAERSRALREENLAELKRNRNTFVLSKLMEDFMEAV